MWSQETDRRCYIRPMRLIVVAVAIALAGSGCGGGDDDGDDGSASDDGADDGSDDDGGDQGGPDGSPGGDGGPGSDAAAGDYIPLVTATWSIAPGDEGYICGTRTLTEDIYAGSLRPMAPLGTHHTTIEMSDPIGPDNPSFPCGPEFGDFYASGVGTQELVLPDGVGLLAPAGQQLRVSLHLFNATDKTLTGVSGLEVRPLDAADVEHTASVAYHGPMSFTILPIEPGDDPQTVTDQSSLGAQTLVGIFPHMHQLGTHFRAVLQRSGGEDVVLWDEAYQFESQEFAPLAEVPVEAGDTLETSCTWTNTTGSPVGWGTSSEAEMCYSILMSY